MGTNYYAHVREYDPELSELERLAFFGGENSTFEPAVQEAVEWLTGKRETVDPAVVIPQALFCLQGWVYKVIHIGKSSGGWCFSLHYVPEEGLVDFATWKAFLERPDVVIEDEWGRDVLFDWMIKEITARSVYAWTYKARDARWYERNQAVPGPNGLARYRLGDHCVAHGEGTWDMIRGEFS